jgi:Protein of unknown function (DUF3455)
MNLSLLTKTGFAILVSSLSIATVQSMAQASFTQAPEPLSVPKGQTLLLTSKAKGSQIYVCRSTPKDTSGYGDEPDTYQWVLKAPEAVLFNAKGLQQGKHYLGPTWEWQDGSKIQGKVKAKVDAPDSQSIPWLLLEAHQPTPMSTKTDAVGGVLNSVEWVQRLNTVGGKAPQTGCDRSSQNREVRVSYTADYYFYRE